MNGELRLGLAGCGRLAERGYSPAFRLARGVRLAAVADPERERCARLAPGVPAYESAAELLAAGGVDALVLATPAEAHLADARLAVAAGVPVLVEKPPAPDAARAAELAALSPPPFVGFNRRFEAGLRRLRGAVPPDGPLELDLALHTERAAWLPHVVRDDALLDLAPHLVDLAVWLTESPVERVRAASLDVARAELELELGRGRARISCAHDRPYRELVSVRAAGRPVGRHAAGGLARRVGERLLRRSAFVASLAVELEALAAAVRGEGAPLATAAEGLGVMRALDAARRSAAAEGAWERVEG